MVGDEFEFSISIKELESAIEFAKRHGETSIQMKVVRASIGNVITVSCPDGSSTIDVTDYDRW